MILKVFDSFNGCHNKVLEALVCACIWPIVPQLDAKGHKLQGGTLNPFYFQFHHFICVVVVYFKSFSLFKNKPVFI